MAEPNEDDQAYSALVLIRSRMASLPPAEAAVARAILDEPFQAMTWSAQEMGTHASTSAATAIRACHHLGFAGLPELRLALARELGWSRLSVDGEHPGSTWPAERMFQQTAGVLAGLGDHLDRASFDRAVEALAGAGRILFVCTGPTQVVAQDARYDLLSIRRPAEFVADSMVQQLAASALGAGDVCVAIGVSGSNQFTLNAARAAAAAGATVIALTGLARSELADLADISVSVSTPDMPVELHAMVSVVAMLIALRAMTAAVMEHLGGVAEFQQQTPVAESSGGFRGERRRRAPRRPRP